MLQRLANSHVIPGDITGQADIWAHYYHLNEPVGTYVTLATDATKYSEWFIQLSSLSPSLSFSLSLSLSHYFYIFIESGHLLVTQVAKRVHDIVNQQNNGPRQCQSFDSLAALFLAKASKHLKWLHGGGRFTQIVFF